MTVKPIDRDETLDYSVNWANWLQAGETISTSAWSIAPSDPTLSGATEAAGVTTTFVSGALRGRVYRLTNRIATTGGRTAERSLILRGMER